MQLFAVHLRSSGVPPQQHDEASAARAGPARESTERRTRTDKVAGQCGRAKHLMARQLRHSGRIFYL
jgi:hypothetical protein